MRRKARVPEGWTVLVCSAEKLSRTYADYGDGYKAERVNGTIAVRLMFNNKPTVTFGTLKINSSNFEDEVTTMKAAAEERCAALNAVGAVAQV